MERDTLDWKNSHPLSETLVCLGIIWAQLRVPLNPQYDRSVVLTLGSIEPQGFGGSVSGVRQKEILSNKSKKKYNSRHTFYFSNYEGFDEYTYGTCRVRYFQQG